MNRLTSKGDGTKARGWLEASKGARPFVSGLQGHSGRLALVLAALATTGCATALAPDPLESLNRKVYAFNDRLDVAVVKPVATAYERTLPLSVRKSVGNFFSNLQDVKSAFNLFLQGRPDEGLRDVGRFATNTTVGVLGVFDVATSMGLKHHGETFGRTLTAWGIEPGAYVVWPLLGPSTARDPVGIPVDWMTNPLSYVDPTSIRYGLTGTSTVDSRASALPLTKTIDAILTRQVSVRSRCVAATTS